MRDLFKDAQLRRQKVEKAQDRVGFVPTYPLQGMCSIVVLLLLLRRKLNPKNKELVLKPYF